METLIHGLIWGELLARRSPTLTRRDRDDVRLRSGVLALAGLPPAVGLAATTNEVRRIERIRRRADVVRPADPSGGLSFLRRGETISQQFSALAQQADSELKAMKESLDANRETLKSQKEILEEARADAAKLKECAEVIEGIFSDDGEPAEG